MIGSAGGGPVGVERDGDIAVLVLDRPPLNLFDEDVFAGYERALARLVEITAPGRPDRARAVLLEARGKVVSAGVDVHAFHDIAHGPDPVGRGTALWSRLIRLAQTIEDLPVPTVFAAHGLTLTAAFELALACDLLLATERATFGLVETVVGLTPSMGGPQRLAERAGPARAKELIYTGERYPAAALHEWGVVNRVLPEDGFAGAARAFTHRLATGPTAAHSATKQLVGTAVRDGVRAADAIVAQVSGALFATEDLRGAVDSFLADGPGKATYRGR
ncbi:enoyl-CoA hydratase/isomerase family protein [Pseudonocardia lacus]|uniref:enoyl-CoA hydratase/isomerase family protein n=1 Tax=Pseudonocardia lacus TaxID=2835865 RepID=UPI0027E2B4BD|nr:enoyl-CoA hydratase/isomerase family protein [Pseudonocardia lacus]